MPPAPQNAPLPRLAIVVSRYNASITGALLEGALAEFERRGGTRSAVAVFDAPGSFELTSIAHAAAASGLYEAIVALGCLVRGETRHDRYIAQSVAAGLTQVAVQTGVPVTFGVLTADNADQARARAGGDRGNKGADAMAAAIDAARCAAAVRAGATSWTAERNTTDKAARPRTNA